jgi:hypothetical protein
MMAGVTGPGCSGKDVQGQGAQQATSPPAQTAEHENDEGDPVVEIVSECARAPFDAGELARRTFAWLLDEGYEMELEMSETEAEGEAETDCPNRLGVQEVEMELIEVHRLSAFEIELCSEGGYDAVRLAEEIVADEDGRCELLDDRLLCLLARSCLEAEDDELAIWMRPAPECIRARARLASEVADGYGLPLPSPEEQARLLEELASAPADSKAEVAAAALGDWTASHRLYGEHVTSALYLYSRTDEAMRLEAVAGALVALFEDMGCEEEFEALGQLRYDEKGEFFAQHCPPEGARLVEPEEARDLPIGSLLLVMAMMHDAARLGVEDTELHESAVSALTEPP